MKLDGTIALFQYWNRLRAGRPAPGRTEIEPADIKALLADTFILEKDARGEAVFRLAGTRLCATYGRELKGFGFSSLWTHKDQRMAQRLAGGTFNARSVAVVGFRGVTRSGRSGEFELLMLPLDGGLQNQRCLGVALAAERPYWLGADPDVESVMDSVRIVDPDREAAVPGSRLERATDKPGIAAERPTAVVAGSNHAARFGRRIRHLIVLEGGRGE